MAFIDYNNTINNININLIINLSISIFIGITLVNVVSKLFSEYGIKLLKFAGKRILLKIFPFNFKIFFINENDDIRTNKVSKIININLPESAQIGVTSTDLSFSIKPEIILPFIADKSEVQVFLVDEKELLGVLLYDKYPGQPTRYQIGKFTLAPNKIQHFKVGIRPKQVIKEYRIPVWIYYNGNKIKDFIVLNFNKI